MLGFFLVVHYLLLPQLAGARESLSVIRHLDPLLLVAGVVAEAMSLVAYAQLTRSLLPGAGRPGLFAVLRVQLATEAASHVVPGGTMAGTPLGFHLLRRAGVEAADASFVLGTQGIGSGVVLNVLLWIALLVSIPIRGTNAAYLSAALGGLVLVGVFALLLVGMSRGSRVAERLVRGVAARLHVARPEAATAFVRSLAVRFRQLVTDRRILWRAVGWAGLQWLADAASLWILLAALGITVPPDELLIAFGLANVSAAIPLTPGGVGVYEAVITSSLVGFGVPKAQAIIGVLAYRLFEFWLPIPIGALAYLSAEASEAATPAERLDKLQDAFTASRDAAPTSRRRRRHRTPEP